MRVNDWIRWTSNDEEGSFFIIGQVTGIKDDITIFRSTTGCVYGIPYGDGEFTRIKKPTGPPTAPKKTTRKSSPKTGTKKEQAQILYNDLNSKGYEKDMIISGFMDQLNMSKAGATTYFYGCRKLAC